MKRAQRGTNFDPWIVESENGVLWLRSPLLHREGFSHAFSTRIGGTSPPPFDSMNLGIADAPGEPDLSTRVNENWRRLLGAVGVSERKLVRAKQVHGCGVLRADRNPDQVRDAPPFAEGDAIISSDPGQVLAIRVADCVPVLIADVRTRAVAAVHAGWRGIISQVVPVSLRTMMEMGSRPQDLRLAIGPCIRQANYQIGSSVAKEFTEADLGQFVVPDLNIPDFWKADLPGAIQKQAQSLGIASTHIDDSRACTFEKPEFFFSYRRDGARGGRLAALICP